MLLEYQDDCVKIAVYSFRPAIGQSRLKNYAYCRCANIADYFDTIASLLYYVKELCLNFLNLKNYVHITKIESCNLYQSALTIFSQKVLGHLDFGMPGSWIWHQKSVFEGSVY